MLDDLEKEYVAFKETHSELDETDYGQTIEEYVNVKAAFYTSKERAPDIIEQTKMRIRDHHIRIQPTMK